ncbi:TetR/AcrR family transcriptional regulator [Streptomyces sp. NPDC021722]|uniref:TetR/AcrR family transcriptional regulator n=2 Tax=Streptomyces TaxID=1883 RepID=A0ABY9UN69_9ACTN|nr:TetR/AcrR family transcriptional regulator [Streptomyces sp. SCA4-21]WNE93943.1 TetR/AcrR family transcriptional regulator [Streptomyces sp. SCA4-21]
MSTRRSNRAGLEAKQRIMQAAVRLFAENGYHATGIELISSESKIGRGALYHHIGNKEAVLFEICHTRMSDLLTQSGRVLAMDATYEQRFRELMRSTMRNLADHVLEWRVAFHEFGALTGQRRVVIQDARDRYESMVAELLEGGAKAGEFRPMDPLVTKGILGMYNFSYAWIQPHGDRAPEEIADLFTNALLEGVRDRDR